MTVWAHEIWRSVAEGRQVSPSFDDGVACARVMDAFDPGAADGAPQAGRRVTALELCCMTVRQATLPELIAVAAPEGFDSLTPTPFLIERVGLGSRHAASSVRRRRGQFRLHRRPLEPPSGYAGRGHRRAVLRHGRGTGGAAINVVHFGGSPGAVRARWPTCSASWPRAARRSLRILIEFLPDTGIPDLPVALELVRQVGCDNLRVMLDTWHLARTGGGPHQLAATRRR